MNCRDDVNEDSNIKKRYKTKAKGQKIYDIYSNSKIGFCNHLANSTFENEKKMLDICGCGALLLTDYKDKLDSIFKIGTQCVTYRNSEEALALIKFYSENSKDAEVIANAGYKRVLDFYSYNKSMEFISNILLRHLKYKLIKISPLKSQADKISNKIIRIEKVDINDDLINSWKSIDIPEIQRELVQSELEQMYKGNIPILFDVLTKLLKLVINEKSEVLELGCSSGYYSEIIEYILGIKLKYTGVDYSESFIKMAKDFYPNQKFICSNSDNIPLNDNSVPIVISAGLLSHTVNYEEQIRESVRIAKNYIVFHRLPLCKNKQTHYNKKQIYGYDMLEIRYNENEILDIFNYNDLKLVKSIEYYTNSKDDEYESSFLFKKEITNENNI